MLDLVTRSRPVQNIVVYPGETFRVVEGVNRGDALSVMDDIVPDDMYRLDKDAPGLRLGLEAVEMGRFEVGASTGIGTPGASVHLDGAMTLMSPQGQTLEAVILVETDPQGHVSQVFLFPLGQLDAGGTYRVVNLGRDDVGRTFAQAACLAFSRGTHITLASGEQRPVEDLKVGDRVLTRNNGAQELRWIGQSTVRASGAFAPIVIKAGTLNNTGDLVVSPAHRLFVYQRDDRIGAGSAELLVRARHLVNGDTVYIQQGGHVDYFQLLFDRHHIIYAEGIAAESMLIEPRTRPALPTDLLEKISPLISGHSSGHWMTHGLDVQRALLDRPDAIDLLRRASMS